MEQPTRAAVYLITRSRIREDRKTSGKIKCNPPNRQCGERCIPPNWKCRVKGEGTDSHSRVVAGDPLAGAASIARGQARLRKGLKTGNVVEIQAGRAAIARGLVKAVPGQNLKQKQELRARVEGALIPVAGTLFAAWAINRGHEGAKLIVPGYKDGIGKVVEEAAATGIGFVFDRIPFYGAAREAARRQANVAGQKLARGVLRSQIQGPDVSPRSNARTYETLAAQSDRKVSGLRSAIESLAPSDQNEGYETYRSRFVSGVIGAKDPGTNKSIFANAAAIEHLSKQFGLDSAKFTGADDNVKKTYLNRAVETKLTETQAAMRQDMSVRGLSYRKQEDVEKYLDVASGYATARFSGLGKEETKSALNTYKGFVRDLVSPISKENSVKTLTSKMYNETVDSFDKYFQQASTRVAQDTSPTARVLIPAGDSPLRASLLGAARFVGPRVGVKIPINSANVAELVLRKTYHELGQQSTGFRSNRKTSWNAPDSDVKAAARDLGWDGNGGIVAAHKTIRATGAFDNLQQLPVVAKPTRTFAPAANRPTKPRTTRKPSPRSRSQIIAMLVKGDPSMSPEAAANEADRIIARRKDEDDMPISVQEKGLSREAALREVRRRRTRGDALPPRVGAYLETRVDLKEAKRLGKPCGESHIPKNHNCTKGKHSSTPSQDNNQSLNLKKWAALGVSAAAVGGIAAVIYNNKLTRVKALRQIKEQQQSARTQRLEEHDAIYNYVSSSYGLNRALRAGHPLDERNSLIKEGLDSWLKNAQRSNGIYYRGISWSSAGRSEWGSLKAGDTISDKAFGSFSQDRRVGLKYGAGADDAAGVVIVARGQAVPLPYHIKSRYNSSLGESLKNEKEVLMPRNSRYRVVRTQDVTFRYGRKRGVDELVRDPNGDIIKKQRIVYVDILE